MEMLNQAFEDVSKFNEMLHAACAAMHRRLVLWGRIWLRGSRAGASPDPDADSDRAEFTGDEAALADALHSRVIALPEVRQRFVLQVFYREGAAARWNHLSPTYKLALLANMTADVNAGLRQYNREAPDPVVMIRWQDFEGIQERSIRILVNNERVTA
jgi:hypothetical protein